VVAVKPTRNRATWLLASATTVGVVAVLFAPMLPSDHSAGAVWTMPSPSGGATAGPRVLRPTPAPGAQRLPALGRYDPRAQAQGFRDAARDLRAQVNAGTDPAAKARVAELERAAQAIGDAELAVAYPPSQALVQGESPSVPASPGFTPASAYAIDLVGGRVVEVVPGSAGPSDPGTGVLVAGPLVVVPGGASVVQFGGERFELPGTGALTFERLVGDVVVLRDAHGRPQAVDLTDHTWFTEAQAATLDPPGATGGAPVVGASTAVTVTVSPQQRAELRRLTHEARTTTDDLARAEAATRFEEIWLAVAAARHTTISAGTSPGTTPHDVVTAGLMPTRNNPTPLDRYVATRDARRAVERVDRRASGDRDRR